MGGSRHGNRQSTGEVEIGVDSSIRFCAVVRGNVYDIRIDERSFIGKSAQKYCRCDHFYYL